MKIMTALFCLLIIIILVIFSPKAAGVEGRPGVQPSTQIWFEEEFLCFGLPHSCQCFKKTITETNELISIEVACNKLN